MRRILQGLFALGVWGMALPAAAQEPEAQPEPNDQAPSHDGNDKTTSALDKPLDKAEPDEGQPAHAGVKASIKVEQQEGAEMRPVATPPTTTNEVPAGKVGGWQTFVSGYFRAPVTMGFSPRANPDNKNGPTRLQVSYGPNRVLDSSYYSFAYTRLQEQDWAELFVHAKRNHAEAVIGWMGYWFQGAGFRNGDASWAPAAAYLTLDTDFELGGMKPNIALTVGSWWPKFGAFAKYDTYTLGQMRQIGEQVKLTLPFNDDLKLTLVQGFGTNRDGSFNYTVNPPIYGSTTGLDLIHYDNIQLTYKKYLDVGLHFNTQWTRDPNLTQGGDVDVKSYSSVTKAYLMTIGGEVSVSAPVAGRLWISPSLVKVRNGWSLANGGVEVMHSLGGAGLASNYLAWTNSGSDSHGSGSILNLGLLYENSLSSILGKPPESLPNLTLNVFGLMANSSLDLPDGSTLTQNRIKQLKYGADLTYQALTWLAVMGRYDEVNYDLDHSGYVFSAVTGRLIFSSHFLSTESIYVQYSRYRYGDKMVLNGQWPWHTPLVAGTDLFQAGPYSGTRPDMDVVKIQANVSF
ncbi:MAG TPA: hypothetical protein VIV60_29750 [Polyangiaceae bacterium]